MSKQKREDSAAEVELKPGDLVKHPSMEDSVTVEEVDGDWVLVSWTFFGTEYLAKFPSRDLGPFP